MELLLAAVTLLLLTGGVWFWRGARKTPGRGLRRVRALAAGLSLFLAILALVGSGYAFLYTHRPLPDNTRETIYEGVTYIRDVRHEPRPLVIHVLLIDLDAPGIRFLVTPGNPSPDGEIRARTTSQFLDEFGLQVAANGDFFEPIWSNSPWDYYPHIGDPVYLFGFASSNGTVYSDGKPGSLPTLHISRDNQADFNTPIGGAYNAISGNTIFLEQGEPRVERHSYYEDLHPRTAAAFDREVRRLILIVVDGRQPNYSEGVTLAELAEIAIEYGGYSALNLDGGGSTTMVVEGKFGEPLVLNSPIDNRIPGRERPVGNHLGIYAHRMTVEKFVR